MGNDVRISLINTKHLVRPSKTVECMQYLDA